MENNKQKVRLLHLGSDVKLPEKHTYRYCKVVKAGNITETIEMTHKPELHCIKINADQYMCVDDGTIGEYQHSTNRAEQQESIRKTIARLRRLINANCLECSKLHWVTLTYAENMTDPEQLHKDYVKFWHKFQRWCQNPKRGGVPVPEYIAVAEPQARGAWHMHVIFIWSIAAPFIDNNTVLAPMWGHGFTKIKGVADCDNIGAYFSAYLADIPVEEGGDKVAGAVKEVGGKKYIKGGRLHMYPAGMQLYRHSKGVVYPDEQVLVYQSATVAKIKASAGTLTYESRVAVMPDAEEHPDIDPSTQIIRHSYYNTRRK